MQKTRSLSIRTIILLIASVLAITLCFTGTARAALAYFSPDYQAEFETSNLGVVLTEKGENAPEKEVSGDGALLQWMTGNPKVGYNYDEELAAVNEGGYDEYVRVVVKKYWTDAEGNKINTLNPELIQLTLDGIVISDLNEAWVVDPASAGTPEQVILYSTQPLAANGGSLMFANKLRIDESVIGEAAKDTTEVTTEDGKTIFTTVYDVDGYSFNIEAEVDAVQDHNFVEAIKSAWGIDPVSLGIGQ